MSVTNELQTKRQQVWHQGKAILDRAISEKRDLSAVEEQAWQQANNDLDALDQRLNQITADEVQLRETEAAFSRIQARPGVENRAVSLVDKDLDVAFRHAILENSRRPIYAYPANPRSGFQPGIEKRALSTSSGSGQLGTTFYNHMLRHLVDSSAILSAGATVVQSTTGETLKVPKSTAHSTAAIVTEGSTISSSDPTLGSVSLTGYKYAFLVKVSHELANDAAFDLLAFLAEQTGVAIGNAFGAHAITGTGSSQPAGVVTGATLGVTGSTGVTGAFNADNLIDTYHSLAEPYARSAGAAWLMRNATLGAVRKLKDSQNRYLFDISAPYGSGASGTLLGRPVYADPNVAAVALSAKSIVFGDMTRYWVRQVEGLRFERSDDFAFDTDQITFRGLARLDGALIDTTGAVKYFAGAAT